jgi:hypothetical protein
MHAQRKYPDELRECALRMILEIRQREGNATMVSWPRPSVGDGDALGCSARVPFPGAVASTHPVAPLHGLPAPDFGGQLEFAASGMHAFHARHARYGVGGSAKAPEVMTAQALAPNTKTPQVRDPEKINTGTTRTKRHYPAQGSAAAKMAA